MFHKIFPGAVLLGARVKSGGITVQSFSIFNISDFTFVLVREMYLLLTQIVVDKVSQQSTNYIKVTNSNACECGK
jgi:hypothetical protein